LISNIIGYLSFLQDQTRPFFCSLLVFYGPSFTILNRRILTEEN